MNPRRIHLLWTVLLVTLAACATAAPSGSSAPSRNSAVITAAEIEAATQTNGYDLVQNLRPRWLQVRGRGSINRPEYVQVYQDGSPVGGVGTLRQIPTHSISQIRYLNGTDATQRFGSDHGSGAILVTTRS